MAELTTLARPYAKAAFAAAMESDSLQSWAESLALVATLVKIDAVKSALTSPSLTGDQQAEMVIALCGDEITAAVSNFVRILAENKRIPLLSEIVQLFEILKANQEKRVDVEMISAFPVADQTQEKLVQALKNKLQRDVQIHSKIDKKLIGGAIIRAGDLVIDGSVRGKLNKLAEAMQS